MDYLRAADRLWPVLGQLVKVHVFLYRATGGVVGHRFLGAPPMLLVDHVGAKSGARRTAALAYLVDGENHVIVASKGGNPRHPAWFHNLRANPETTIQVGPKRLKVRAREASDAEHSRLWPKVVRTYGGFSSYQERTTRKIPLVILEPRKS
ncbi:MAG: nitroreductase family deazaflavin-dependent oxidoreductase [Actinomycetota bacterium]